MQLKTSTKISIKFTVFTLIIVAFFGMAHNILFFRSRYLGVHTRFQHHNKAIDIPGPFKLIPSRRNIQEFPIQAQETQIITDNIVWRNIGHYDGEWYVYVKQRDKLLVTLVTQQVEAQLSVIRTTLILLLVFGAISYFLSLLFVKTSLKKLNELVHFAQEINLDTLHKKLKITGPHNDEINIVASKLNESFDLIHKQTQALKDFVRNASHELKTPLAVMLTEIDLGLKAKTHKATLEKLKQEIKQTNALLETLLLIAKAEDTTSFVKKRKKLGPIVSEVLHTTQQQFLDKQLSIHEEVDTTTQRSIHEESFRMICKNLIENACKYTPNKGKISINLDSQALTIHNTGAHISKEQQDKIRDRFRQADPARSDTQSFGLGLYLVKLFVEKHGRTVQVTSSKTHGTSFIVSF